MYQRIKGMITWVTYCYLSPWPRPLCTASLLRGSCHYGNHDISSMPVVRFCSREGVNEKRKWRIKREAACKGGREINKRERERERDLCSKQRGFCQRLQIPFLYRCMLPGQLQHVGLPSIPLVKLIDEVGPFDSMAISVPQQAMPHPISPLTPTALLSQCLIIWQNISDLLPPNRNLEGNVWSKYGRNVQEIKYERFSLCLIHSHTSLMFWLSNCVCGGKWKAASQTGNTPH